MKLIAVLGYVGLATNDGRVLLAQSGYSPPRPVPIYTREYAGNPRDTLQLGVLYDWRTLGHVLIGYGEVTEHPAGRPALAALCDGKAHLMIDLAPTIRHDRHQEPGGPMMYLTWSLMAVTVGTSPAWDLPPVQFIGP